MCCTNVSNFILFVRVYICATVRRGTLWVCKARWDMCVNTGEGLMAAQRFGAAAALPGASHKAAGFYPVPCCCAALQALMIEAQQHAMLFCAVLCCAVLCCAVPHC